MGRILKWFNVLLLGMVLWAGVSLAAEPGIIGINYKVTQWGAQVTAVTPDGPAAKAGIRVGDIITKVDRFSLAGTSQQQMSNAIGGSAGTAAIFTISNQRGQYQKAVARIARPRSARAVTPPAKGFIGISYTATQYGAKITQVTPNSGAAKAGIRVGDYLIKANNISLAGMTLQQISNTISGAPGTSIDFAVSNRSGIHLRRVIRGTRPGTAAKPKDGLVGISWKPNQWGAQITSVTPGGPAAKAGIRVGDTVTVINNVKVVGKNIAQIKNMFEGPAGSTLTLTVANRAGYSNKTLIRASRSTHPSMVQSQVENKQNGVIGINFVPNKWGMRITSVTPNSPAARAGVTTNDTLTAVNGRSIAGYKMEQVQKLLLGPAGARFVLTFANRLGSRNLNIVKQRR